MTTAAYIRNPEVAGSWDEMVQERLARLEKEGLLRRLTVSRRLPGGLIERNGRTLINFSSNDYLGLSHHPAIAEAASAASKHGSGSTASRLMAGDDEAVRALERKVAAFKGSEAAIVLGSGYLANAGAIPVLVGRNDAVFSDRLNHASIVDGIRISGAKLHRYPHRDMKALEEMLRAEPGRRKLIVTETVFGMDGDAAPLADIAELKQRYRAALMVDEAHAGGVFGPRGEGLAAEAGVAGEVDIAMGTFGKAFGVYGAYLSGRRPWIELMVSACRTFIYTTALPPAVVAAVSRAVDVVDAAGDLRARLRRSAQTFREAAAATGMNTGASTTQIVPVILGAAGDAVAAGSALGESGVLAVPVRPPTVPRGTARLRFSLTAEHTPEQIENAVSALAAAVR
ncbi:MAG: aminotransferase class I/II-fold pyridoxal phosphate-dependent enzyme [Actinomycetota bacterium]